ncbi:MAG: alpha/beta hydrolase [Faecalibacterium sp.]
MQLKQLELEGGGTLTVYLRDSCERMPKAIDRPLVLVVPGGGYTHVSAREGDPVALQFAAAGYHAAVLDYAICEQAKDGLPLRQLAQAIGLVRQHAAGWHILPEKIAVCGFSAGGHLALSGAVLDIPGSGPAPARCGNPGLSGDHGRAVCPPRQFCAAGGQH